MTKPAPFKRPSISLGSHGRIWQQVRARHLVSGDVVSERGLVDQVVFHGRAQQVEVSYLSREVDILEPDEQVFAFARKVETDG